MIPMGQGIKFAVDDLRAQIAAKPNAPASSLNLATLQALVASTAAASPTVTGQEKPPSP